MTIDQFIAFWADTEGGAERANTAPYILGLLQALDLPPPDPAGATTLHNDYVFERAVQRAAGEALDAHRRAVLADKPDLALTALYNCLEQVRAGTPLDAKAEAIKQSGLIIILRDLHDAVDQLTASAYGWPEGLSTEALVARLVALNQMRAQDEAAGQVHWLRPDDQQRQVGAPTPQNRSLTLVDSTPASAAKRPAFPTDRYAQPLAVQALLRSAGPIAPPDLARRFSGGVRLEPRISRVLATLHRYGHAERLPDGRWAAARAA